MTECEKVINYIYDSLMRFLWEIFEKKKTNI